MEARLALPNNIRHITVVPGWSVEELIRFNVPERIQPYVVVLMNGKMVMDVETTHVQDGDNLLVCVVPQGGGGSSKGALGAILSIAVAAFAWYAAPYALGAMQGLGLGVASTTTGLSLALTSAGISLIGNLLIGALIPPPSIGNTKSRSAGAETYTITSQSNQANPFGAIPKLYGRMRMFPYVATIPYSRNVGKSSLISAIYDFGYGNVQLEDFRIGDTEASIYSPEIVVHSDSLVQNVQFISRKVSYSQFTYTMSANVVEIETEAASIQAEVEIQFPAGLFSMDKDGDIHTMTTNWYGEYRSVSSSGAWTGLSYIDAGGIATVDLVQPARATPAQLQVSYTKRTWMNQVFGGGGYWQESKVTEKWLVVENSDLTDGITKPSGFVGIMKSGQTTLYGHPGYLGGYPPFNKVTAIAWLAPYVAPPVARGFYVKSNHQRPFTVLIGFNFPAAGKYDIRVERIDAERIHPRRMNKAVLSSLRSYGTESPLKLRNKHTMVEMRIQGNEKISGAVQNFSALATSVLRTTTNGVNFNLAATRNPAWICLDILCGEVNPKPLTDDLIDWPSWIHLAQVCDEQRTYNVGGNVVTKERFTCDIIVDTQLTVKELLESILSGCRASLKMTSAGKYGVLIDEEKVSMMPRQLISPANSWGFNGTRAFPDIPHALHVSYIEPTVKNARTTTIVYADGYNENNAETFEELNTFGITDYVSAWLFGRYMMGQGIIRSEEFNVTMDIENIVCSRGDLVYVAHDVVKVGGYACRVTAIQGNQVTINSVISVPPTGYSIRLNDGSVRTGRIISAIDENTFVFDTVAGINPDDLLIIGMYDNVTQPYLVKQITPASDMTATLSLVKYDPALYIDGNVPEWKPGFGDDLINTTDVAVVSVAVNSQLVYHFRFPFCQFNLVWQHSGYAADTYYILATNKDGVQRAIGETKQEFFTWELDVIRDQGWTGNVRFEVIPVTATGVQGRGATVETVTLQDTVPPENITGFGVNVQDMTTNIIWSLNDDIDIDYYELRYSPDAVNGVWNASQLIGYYSFETGHASVGSRTGLYMLQVVDTSGNKSAIASQRTTIEYLPNVNQVLTANDDTIGWIGNHYQTETVGGNVQLIGDADNVINEGYYDYAGFIDLHDVYEVRLSSKIMAYGTHSNDLMAKWITLAEVNPLARASSSDWNVTVEYRAIDDVVVMADWPLLSDPIADPIGGIESHTWSPWRAIQVSDITARYIQIRLHLESFDPQVRTIVTDGLIEVDAPDRIWKKNDIAVDVGGIRVLYDPPFMMRPVVAITMENTNAVSYQISNANRSGFDIQLFDTLLRSAVAGQIDVSALGNGRQKLTSI